MKPIDEIIKSIKVNKANLDHISTNGVINGSLYMSLQEIIRNVQKEAYNEAMEVDKESILKLKQ